MIPKNKIGAEKTISVYWFVILILVSGAIVYMVSIFYGVPYDVSEMEANILINNVADCISEEGKLKEGVFLEEEFKNNFLKKCHLNIEENSDGRYYVEVSFSDFNTKEKREFNLVGGNINLKDSFENYLNPDQMTSSKKSFYTKTWEGDKELVVEIFVIVKKI